MKQVGQGPDTGELWSKREVADFYRVSERTIDRWLAAGVIPSDAKIVLGSTVRLRPRSHFSLAIGGPGGCHVAGSRKPSFWQRAASEHSLHWQKQLS